jgi:hypothetical protein
MATPSNPGWVTGYVPTAAQWAAAFSSKVDYPGPISQGGTGATSSAGAAYNIEQRALILSNGINLQPLTSYGVRTSLGAFTGYLPALSILMPGDWIDLYDVDYAASTNNFTITANGTDLIYLYASSGTSQALTISGVRVRFVVNQSGWRMLV